MIMEAEVSQDRLSASRRPRKALVEIVFSKELTQQVSASCTFQVRPLPDSWEVTSKPLECLGLIRTFLLTWDPRAIPESLW